MAVRHLFGEDDRWTQEANDIANRARKALEPLVQECANKGISMRDLEYVILQEVSCLCLANILVPRCNTQTQQD